jgi:hypothetical protein
MKHTFVYFYLIINLFTALPASATSMLPLTLEQLSTRADLIFYGKVISNEVKKDAQSGHIATFTEFKIINLIKGTADSTHTIKQVGGFHKDSNTRLMIHGVPEFQIGKEYVVFLPKKSSLGFCSPLGLHQGSFPVSTENDEKIINSGRHLAQQPSTLNRDVQVPLAVRADNPSQSRLDDFINTVRAYNTP